jgi:hypothetical protein
MQASIVQHGNKLLEFNATEEIKFHDKYVQSYEYRFHGIKLSV